MLWHIYPTLNLICINTVLYSYSTCLYTAVVWSDDNGIQVSGELIVKCYVYTAIYLVLLCQPSAVHLTEGSQFAWKLYSQPYIRTYNFEPFGNPHCNNYIYCSNAIYDDLLHCYGLSISAVFIVTMMLCLLLRWCCVYC